MRLSNDFAWVVATTGDEWSRGDGWWVAGPLFLAFWIAVIATVIWLAVRAARRRDHSGIDRARDVLADRYARGELTTDEYRERAGQLR